MPGLFDRIKALPSPYNHFTLNNSGALDSLHLMTLDPDATTSPAVNTLINLLDRLCQHSHQTTPRCIPPNMVFSSHFTPVKIDQVSSKKKPFKFALNHGAKPTLVYHIEINLTHTPYSFTSHAKSLLAHARCMTKHQANVMIWCTPPLGKKINDVNGTEFRKSIMALRTEMKKMVDNIPFCLTALESVSDIQNLYANIELAQNHLPLPHLASDPSKNIYQVLTQSLKVDDAAVNRLLSQPMAGPTATAPTATLPLYPSPPVFSDSSTTPYTPGYSHSQYDYQSQYQSQFQSSPALTKNTENPPRLSFEASA